MFKFYDWRDFGQPADDLYYTGANQVVRFEPMVLDLKDIYNPDILVNGEPNPVLFEDSFHF